MTRVYSEIPKFKRVEASLREATNAYRRVIAEIDKALAGRRTAKETDALVDLRKRCSTFHKESLAVLGGFYDTVEGSDGPRQHDRDTT